MRDFGKVPKEVWVREDISANAKLILTYLYTHPHRQQFANGYVHQGYIAEDTGLSPAATNRAILRLIALGLVDNKGKHVALQRKEPN